MYATTLMVIVAVAAADVEKAEQIFLPLWGKEVSPSGGGHLPMINEEDTTLYVTIVNCTHHGSASCGPGGVIFFRVPWYVGLL